VPYRGPLAAWVPAFAGTTNWVTLPPAGVGLAAEPVPVVDIVAELHHAVGRRCG